MALLAASSRATAFSTMSKALAGRRSSLVADAPRRQDRPAFLSTRGGALLSSTAAADQDEATTTKTAYQELVQKLEAITHLGRAQAVLGYDQQVFMPASASAERGAQLAALATVLHQQRTDPKLLELMDQALEKESASLQADEFRLLELERKNFVENAKVPSELAARAAELSSSAYSDWVKAREAKDFSMFEDTLHDCFNTAMKLATAKQGSADNLYDFMLDEFEIGMSQTRINTIFEQVETTLVPLIQKVLTSPNPVSADALQGEFEIDQQQQLSDLLVKAIGFNAEQGRIDVSVHPFTSSMSPSDVRITSRFRTDEWYQGLAGSLHEGGHAIYEQSLPSSALSIDTALSMGTHESQSLFWERHVGLSKAFWKYATPILHETLTSTKEYSDEAIYGYVRLGRLWVHHTCLLTESSFLSLL
jgi:carboxypeptidase Taq